MKNSKLDYKKLINKHIEKYVSTLAKEDLVNFKPNLFSIFYNILVTESLLPQQLEIIASILFENCEKETYSQLKERIK